MPATIATLAPPIPIWASMPMRTSRPRSSSRRTCPRCCGRSWAAVVDARAGGDRDGNGCLPALRGALPAHPSLPGSAARRRHPGQHRHQVDADPARSRPAHRAGPWTRGHRLFHDHHAGHAAVAAHRAGHTSTTQAPRGHAAPSERGSAVRRLPGADPARHHRCSGIDRRGGCGREGAWVRSRSAPRCCAWHLWSRSTTSASWRLPSRTCCRATSGPTPGRTSRRSTRRRCERRLAQIRERHGFIEDAMQNRRDHARTPMRIAATVAVGSGQLALPLM